MAMAGLNFIKEAMAYKAELCSSDAIVFADSLKKIWLHIADLICKVENLEVTYEGAQMEFISILEYVGEEVREYLDKQSTAVFMDESFQRGFYDAFNVSPLIPVEVGMAITHHSLLKLLRVNMSHILLQMYLSSLTSGATVASGQMALLSYIAEQSVVMW